ncbi:interferon a3-like [Girardinichthys multiradiatus]|uniref:interferon a3-like n=1 Tax=Girardinichthys multiradiatus TaxID=208333 RepID=UPI001FAC3267|nr:interferon a3-like [Girardinichthys multiradiatus]
MLSRIFFACVFLCLCCACSPLSCRWMDHKFRQYSENSLNLLDMMAYHYVNQDAGVNSVPFPHQLYNQAYRASAEGRFAFTIQILKEVCALFEEDDSSSSWQEITVEHFLNVVNKQADELQLCVGNENRPNRRLQAYFKRLSRTVFEQLGHSAEAWELIRREIKVHLLRVDHLVSSLFTSN